MTPITMNASGRPVTPVDAQPDSTRPPTTSSGAAAVMANIITAGTPSRSLANEAVTLPGLIWVVIPTPDDSNVGKRRSFALRQDGGGDERLDLGDEGVQGLLVVEIG